MLSTMHFVVQLYTLPVICGSFVNMILLHNIKLRNAIRQVAVSFGDDSRILLRMYKNQFKNEVFKLNEEALIFHWNHSQQRDTSLFPVAKLRTWM
jgi:hypothetical protein